MLSESARRERENTKKEGGMKLRKRERRTGAGKKIRERKHWEFAEKN